MSHNTVTDIPQFTVIVNNDLNPITVVVNNESSPTLGISVNNDLSTRRIVVRKQSYFINHSNNPIFNFAELSLSSSYAETASFALNAGGASTLQEAYDNSTTPEILTDAIRGAFTLQQGSGNDSDRIIEVLNGVGNLQWYVDGLGSMFSSGSAIFSSVTSSLYGTASWAVSSSRSLITNAVDVFSGSYMEGLTNYSGSFSGSFAHFGVLGVGTTVIDPSAAFELISTTKGVLFPRMSTTQRDAIYAPAEGLVIYNNTTKKLNVFTTFWEQIS